MVYTLSANRRDNEYNKFVGIQPGSLASIAVSVVSGLVSATITDTITTTSVGAANPFLNIGTSHIIGSTTIWPATAGSKLVATDIICSTQSGTGENRISLCIEGGDERLVTYLASNGGFVSNLNTPLRTIVGGSLTMTTTTIGSTSMSIGGYLE